MCSEPIVSVIDPRHPLCGQSFPLRGMISRPEIGPCCIVWPPEGLERHIPLTATNLGAPMGPVTPCPLSLAGLQALLGVYARLIHPLPEGAHDYGTSTPDAAAPHNSGRDLVPPATSRRASAPTDLTPGGVGLPDPAAATTPLPPASAPMLRTAAPTPGRLLRGDAR